MWNHVHSYLKVKGNSLERMSEHEWVIVTTKLLGCLQWITAGLLVKKYIYLQVKKYEYTWLRGKM